MTIEQDPLYSSLVGSSTEYRFNASFSGVTSIDQNILSERKKISKDINEALSTGGILCVMLLAELTNYYRREVYYMAVRSAIEMRRYRPAVLEYLLIDIQERAERLKSVLSEKLRGDKNRDLKVTIARYFLGVYPSRLLEFKRLLTREEFTYISTVVYNKN